MAVLKHFGNMDIPTNKHEKIIVNETACWNYIQSNDEYIQQFVDLVKERSFSWKKKIRILDVGCGDGNSLLRMKKALARKVTGDCKYQFMGIEVQPQLAELAQKRFPQALIYNADASHCEHIYKMADFIYLYRPIYDTPAYRQLLNHIWGLVKPETWIYQAWDEELPSDVYRSEMLFIESFYQNKIALRKRVVSSRQFTVESVDIHGIKAEAVCNRPRI